MHSRGQEQQDRASSRTDKDIVHDTGRKRGA